MRHLMIPLAAIAALFAAQVNAAQTTSGPERRIELSDRQLDTMKAGAPNCANLIGSNPNCKLAKANGNTNGCKNNKNCTPRFKP